MGTIAHKTVRRPKRDTLVDAASPFAETPALSSVPRSPGFSIEHRDLKAALALASNVADPKSTMPILATVLLRSVARGTVEMLATDLNLYLTLKVPCVATQDFTSCAIEAKRLSQLVKALPEGRPVTLEPDRTNVRLSCDAINARLGSFLAQDFPRFPTLGETKPTAVDADVLCEALDAVAFSVCRDETRFHLNGILVESNGETLIAVSTDGHRLTKARRQWVGPAINGIVPADGVREIRRMLAKVATCDVALVQGKDTSAKYLYVAAGNATLYVKMIDAQFPSYEQVIPKDGKRTLTVERVPLIKALERAKLLGSETRGVSLEMGRDSLTIASDNPDVGEVKESVKVQCTSEAFTWGVNPIYLLEILGRLADDWITIAFSGAANAALDPALVRGAEDAAFRPLGESYLLGVVMPMRVK